MFVDPSEEQLAAVRALDHEGPITMLNLLRFKSDGGRERYQQYGRAAGPLLDRAGATTRYLGAVTMTVIGGEPWDLVILVDYPSAAAFHTMVTDPEYPMDIRAEALVDSRLYCLVRNRSL